MTRARSRLLKCVGTCGNSVLAAMVVILACRTGEAEDRAAKRLPPVESAITRQLATLANQDILESSGLAASHDVPNRFWTHNDSGDKPRLFAFDNSGRDLGVVHLASIEAVDWEDISSFRVGDRGWLLIADVGDNARRRDTCQLHLLPEPDLRRDAPAVHSTIEFRYASGPVDCEAVGVDGTSNIVLLASKSAFRSEVFALRIPATPTSQIQVARSIATIPVPLATGLDVSTDGRRAIVVTYADGYEFQRLENESWSDTFNRQPQAVTMPIRRQGESICYAADGHSLYLTSERQPTPLWIVERTP